MTSSRTAGRGITPPRTLAGQRLTTGIRALLRTNHDVGPLLLRLTLAVVFFPHGAQKLLGWFGGPGYSAAMDHFTSTKGIPPILGFLAIMAEFFGPLGLFVGLLGRVAAFGIGVVMVVAALTSHLQYGFFMNWFGTQQGEGFEYHLLAIGVALVIMIKGSGAWSIDRALAARTAVTHAGPGRRCTLPVIGPAARSRWLRL